MDLSLGLSLGSRPVGGAGGVLLGDQQSYSANGYTAWAGPWSTYPGGANAGLSRPADYADTIRVFPASFPAKSVISWRWPKPGPGTVAGYMHIARGNYDGSAAGGFTPWQVGNITSFTETIDVALTGADVSDATVLNEFYLTNASGADTDKAFEIAHWLHAATDAATWFGTQTAIGQFTDGAGRVWDVKNCGLNPVGATYIVFRLASGADLLVGAIDKKAALQWLVTKSAIGNHLWVNGTAIGVEPYRGSGTMTVNSYAVAFAGAGSVIAAPPSNLLVNGDFSADDAGWTGFWYSGKSIDYTNKRAVFTGGVPYDGIWQSVSLTAGKYYEASYTITRTAGTFRSRFTGGTLRYGAEYSAAGTYTERLLANSGNNAFDLIPSDAGFSGTVDNVVLTGPYTTATVGGA